MSDADFYQHICANECRNTHHKLVMNALKHLSVPDAGKWRSLFLKHFELFLEGSKAPDTKFKDFRNHVLHVSDNFWGGPVAQAEKWYAQTIDDLKNQRWKSAVYSAGVLSHYYMDPLMPLHTGQSEEEGVMHRACEWSVNKSFDSLINLLETTTGYPSIDLPNGDNWLKKAIHEGATKANRHYQDFIDHYDPVLGSRDPKAGLDEHLQKITAQLLGHASIGYARILDKLFAQTSATPTVGASVLAKSFYKLTLPVSWCYSLYRHMTARSRVRKIAAEFKAKGKVIQALPQDEKALRKLHAEEVLKIELSELDAKEIGPVGAKSTARARVAPQRAAKKKRFVRRPPKQHKARPEHFRLNLNQPLEDAPSIGPKTAQRFQIIGIKTIAQFLSADPDLMASQLDTRHIQSATVKQWQTQARLACQIPRIYGHDAQILVACGFDSPEEIADSEPAVVLSLVDEFAKTEEAKFIIRGKKPDLKEVTNWIDWSKQSRQVEAA